jgi:hypothetical protein
VKRADARLVSTLRASCRMVDTLSADARLVDTLRADAALVDTLRASSRVVPQRVVGATASGVLPGLRGEGEIEATAIEPYHLWAARLYAGTDGAPVAAPVADEGTQDMDLSPGSVAPIWRANVIDGQPAWETPSTSVDCHLRAAAGRESEMRWLHDTTPKSWAVYCVMMRMQAGGNFHGVFSTCGSGQDNGVRCEITGGSNVEIKGVQLRLRRNGAVSTSNVAESIPSGTFGFGFYRVTYDGAGIEWVQRVVSVAGQNVATRPIATQPLFDIDPDLPANLFSTPGNAYFVGGQTAEVRVYRDIADKDLDVPLDELKALYPSVPMPATVKP